MGSTPRLIHLCKWVWVRAYKRRDLCPRGPITGIEKALRNKICTVEIKLRIKVVIQSMNNTIA